MKREKSDNIVSFRVKFRENSRREITECRTETWPIIASKKFVGCIFAYGMQIGVAMSHASNRPDELDSSDPDPISLSKGKLNPFCALG